MNEIKEIGVTQQLLSHGSLILLPDVALNQCNSCCITQPPKYLLRSLQCVLMPTVCFWSKFKTQFFRQASVFWNICKVAFFSWISTKDKLLTYHSLKHFSSRKKWFIVLSKSAFILPKLPLTWMANWIKSHLSVANDFTMQIKAILNFFDIHVLDNWLIMLDMSANLNPVVSFCCGFGLSKSI